MSNITEHHPNWYRDIPEMSTLILGSFPPHKKQWDYEFYYPNAQNRFWKILADIDGFKLKHFMGLKPEAVEERHQVMKRLKCGVQNIGKTIEREGESALDTKIKITEYQDIISIIQAHSELSKILLPGYSAPYSTARGFVKYLRKNKVPIIGKVIYKCGEHFRIMVSDRIIDCHIIYSTSTAVRKKYDVVKLEFEKLFNT
jgi:G:T/U-mismatch repair DNA glycosylase